MAALCVCVAAVVAQDACVLAEPSGELPRLPAARPQIVHASVVPTTSKVLTNFPSSLQFIVPVELADRTSDVVYVAFVDYNPLTGEGLVDKPRTSQFSASNSEGSTTEGRTRILTVPIPKPVDSNRCHVIEIIVALRLKAETDSKNAHTPDEPGGDVATWFYNPTGDLGACPTLTLDAGVDAASSPEAGEGGVQ